MSTNEVNVAAEVAAAEVAAAEVAAAEVAAVDAESVIVTAIAKKAIAALVKSLSKKHVRFLGKTESTDVFLRLAFLVSGESFAVVRGNRAQFIHIHSLNLDTDYLLIAVTPIGESAIANPFRAGKLEYVANSGGSVLIPVKVKPDATLGIRFDSVDESYWRYASKDGVKQFTRLGESTDYLPSLKSVTLSQFAAGIGRRLKAYVNDSAVKHDDRVRERDGKLTNYGQRMARQESRNHKPS